MHDEYSSRAKQHSITCDTWSSRSPTSSPPQLLLVAVECGGWQEIKTYLDTLIRHNRLSRIVVDEAHLLLKHESFRPCVNLLSHFGQVPVPIVLMTATLPRALEQKLFSKLSRQVYAVLRRSTERPEIAHTMIAVDEENSGLDLEDTVVHKIKASIKRLGAEERILLFCLSRQECDRMAEKLGWKAYHADVDVADRLRHLQAWRSGEILGLACTSMLNCCLDYSAVRFVFHLKAPRDVMDYAQAVGRGSRDGQRCESIVFFESTKGRKDLQDDPFGEGAMRDTMQDPYTCRRLRLDTFLDGTAKPCAMLPGGQLCDVCVKQIHDLPLEGGPALFPTHLGQPSQDDVPLLSRSSSVATLVQSNRSAVPKADEQETERPGQPTGSTQPDVVGHIGRLSRKHNSRWSAALLSHLK
jgi:superfamily II DNA helicase RecQ